MDRSEQIVGVLVDAFADLIEADPRAFRRKFRKMAQDPFSFYRGRAIGAVLDDDFARGLAQFGAAYGATVRDDHRLFVDAFRNGRIPGL